MRFSPLDSVFSSVIFLVKILSPKNKPRSEQGEGTGKSKSKKKGEFSMSARMRLAWGARSLLIGIWGVLLLAGEGRAQGDVPLLDWAIGIGSSGKDRTGSIAIDADGNVLVAGRFEGTVDVDPGPGTTLLTSNGGTDVFVASYDPSGNLNWALSFGGPNDEVSNGIAVDPSGNVIVTGHFWDSMDVDPGPGTFTLTSNGERDVFVVSFSSSGTLNWALSFGGVGWDAGQDLIVDNAGNVLVVGHFEDSMDVDPGPGTTLLTSNGWEDPFVASYDPNGNLNWAFSFGGITRDRGYDIAVDELGNIYITGFFGVSIDVDPGPGTTTLTGGQGHSFYVASYDPGRSLRWAFSFGTGTQYFTEGRAIATDGAGNVIVTGRFGGTADVDPGPGTTLLTSNGGDDVFLASYDSGGNLNWALNFGDVNRDVAYGLAVDPQGNAVITGIFRGSVDVDPGPDTVTLTSNSQGDTFVASYDPNGNLNWAFSFGDTALDVGNGVAIDDRGRVAIVGDFSGSVDVDPGSASTVLTSNGDLDAFALLYRTHFSLTIEGAGDGSGTVTGPGISCTLTAGTASGDCTELFPPGTAVTLSATADPDSVFAGWSGDPDCSDGQVTLTQDLTCVATFDAVPPPPVGGDPPIWGSYVVFPTPELPFGSGPDRDLNRDRDLDDCVLRYRDLTTGRTVNTRLIVSCAPGDVDLYRQTIVFVDGQGRLGLYDLGTGRGRTTEIRGRQPSIHGSLVAFETPEGVIAVWDTATGRVEELAAGREPAIWGSLVAFRGEGGRIGVYDLRRRTLLDTGARGREPAMYESVVAFTAPAPQRGKGVEVIRYFDVATGQLYDTGAVGSFPAVWGERIVFQTREGLARRDLNGDGDRRDTVLRYFDLRERRVINTGQVGYEPDLYEDVVAYWSYEPELGRDLNGDGDLHDPVVITYPLGAAERGGVPAPGRVELEVVRRGEGIWVRVRGLAMGRGPLGLSPELRLQIYDLSGRPLYGAVRRAGIGESGLALPWRFRDARGLPVAQGVYLAIVTVKDPLTGVELRRILKLVVLR